MRVENFFLTGTGRQLGASAPSRRNPAPEGNGGGRGGDEFPVTQTQLKVDVVHIYILALSSIEGTLIN